MSVANDSKKQKISIPSHPTFHHNFQLYPYIKSFLLSLHIQMLLIDEREKRADFRERGISGTSPEI
jgi:hypothetical protein